MTDIKLLPPPKWLLEGFTDPTIEMLCDYTRANVEHHTAELQDEIATLRAALESMKAHMGNAVMNRDGIIKALSETRDEQGDEIHRLRAELREAWSAVDSKAGWEWKKRAEQAEAEVSALRAEREVIGAETVKYAEKSGRLEAKVDRLTEALRIAEAALADIGDADREPGDDVEWCERRASLGLRKVRDTLRDHDKGASFRPSTPKP